MLQADARPRCKKYNKRVTIEKKKNSSRGGEENQVHQPCEDASGGNDSAMPCRLHSPTNTENHDTPHFREKHIADEADRGSLDSHSSDKRIDSTHVAASQRLTTSQREALASSSPIHHIPQTSSRVVGLFPPSSSLDTNHSTIPPFSVSVTA